MKPRPLEEAKNSGLRGSFPALQRAALRAREIAASTRTLIVISRNGQVDYRYPDPNLSSMHVIDEAAATVVQELPAGFGKKP